MRGQGGNEHGGSPRFQGRGEPGRAPAGEGRKPVGCLELAMTHRSASRCVFATHPTCWRPGSVVGPQRPLGHCSPAPRLMPPAGNWLRFSCSISPLFVLSHSLPMVNIMGKLALFGRFSITASIISSISLATGSWLLTTSHAPRPHAPRHPSHLPPGPAGSGREQTLPRWRLPATDRRIAKDRTGPDLDERPHYFIMSPIRAISSDKSIRFSPLAAARPLTIRSWPEGLNATILVFEPRCLHRWRR